MHRTDAMTGRPRTTPLARRPLAWVIAAACLSGCGREDPPQSPVPSPPSATPSASEQSSGQKISREAALRWMTYQYLSNDPERAPEMVEALIRSRWHEVNPEANALGVLSVFLGRLGAVHPEGLDAWVERAEDLSPETRFVIAYAAWEADPANAEARVTRLARTLNTEDAQALTGFLEQAPPDLAAMQPNAGIVLDFWWAAFMADGDTAWVDLVLGVIPAPGVAMEDSGLDDPARLEVARGAAWSLISNAGQHPRVLEHLRSRLDEAGGDWPTVAEIVRAGEEAAAANPPVLP